MRYKITYKDIVKKLLKLEFKEERIKGSHLVLKNKKFNSIIVLPLSNSNKIVQPFFMISLRKNLIGKGILNNEEFENLFKN